MNRIDDIDGLIGKFLAGEATPEEAMLLEDWKDESPDNRQYFSECEQIFHGGNAFSLEETDSARGWTNVSSRLEKAPAAKVIRPHFSWSRIAAAAVVLIGFGGIIAYLGLNKGTDAQIFTASEKTRSVSLNDGTGIRIASHSSVTLDKNYGKKNRLLKLKGSAYFTVKHDGQKPFIIDAGGVFIKDLGTKFDVRSVQDTIFIEVDEGTVMIYNRQGVKITLEANESAYYVISTNDIRITVENQQLQSSAPIQLVFDDQKLGAVVNSLNKMYRTHIRLENKALENCTLTTRFQNEKLDIVLTVITETLGLTWEKADDGYLIKGTACHS